MKLQQLEWDKDYSTEYLIKKLGRDKLLKIEKDGLLWQVKPGYYRKE